MRPRRRGRQRDQGTGVALFPFLAVLLCTMGALVLLLVVLSRRAQDEAHVTQQRKVAESLDAMERAEASLTWRMDVIRQSRAVTQQDLRDVRNELAFVESARQKLLDEYARAQERLASIDEAADAPRAADSPAQAEVARERSLLEAALERREAARRAANSQPPRYAILPYDGPHGTRRQPIYIECLPDRVVLQPEQIVLTASDFIYVERPDNPLAVAIRAVTEYRREQSGQYETAAAPYPLVIVRPGGASAFAAVRRALSAWKGELGYQVVPSEWELAYPPADPALLDAVYAEVRRARATHEALASAAPKLYGQRGAETPGSQGEGSGPSGPSGHRVGSTNPSALDSVRFRGAPTGDDVGAPSNTRSPSSPRATGSNDGTIAMRSSRPTPGESGEFVTARTVEPSAMSGQQTPRHDPRRVRSAIVFPSQLDDQGGPSSGPSSGTASTRSVIPFTRPDLSPRLAQETPGFPVPAKPGATSAGETFASATRDADGDAAAGQATSGDATSPPSFVPSVRVSLPGHGPLDAVSRNGRRPISIDRPIRVQCFHNRLVLDTTSQRSGNPTVLYWDAGLQSMAQSLGAVIAAEVEAWGVAGHNMVWSPGLRVYVEDGETAAGRFETLVRMMQGSGISVQMATRTARSTNPTRQ